MNKDIWEIENHCRHNLWNLNFVINKAGGGCNKTFKDIRWLYCDLNYVLHWELWFDHGRMSFITHNINPFGVSVLWTLSPYFHYIQRWRHFFSTSYRTHKVCSNSYVYLEIFLRLVVLSCNAKTLEPFLKCNTWGPLGWLPFTKTRNHNFVKTIIAGLHNCLSLGLRQFRPSLIRPVPVSKTSPLCLKYSV